MSATTTLMTPIDEARTAGEEYATRWISRGHNPLPDSSLPEPARRELAMRGLRQDRECILAFCESAARAFGREVDLTQVEAKFNFQMGVAVRGERPGERTEVRRDDDPVQISRIQDIAKRNEIAKRRKALDADERAVAREQIDLDVEMAKGQRMAFGDESFEERQLEITGQMEYIASEHAMLDRQESALNDRFKRINGIEFSVTEEGRKYARLHGNPFTEYRNADGSRLITPWTLMFERDAAVERYAKAFAADAVKNGELMYQTTFDGMASPDVSGRRGKRRIKDNPVRMWSDEEVAEEGRRRLLALGIREKALSEPLMSFCTIVTQEWGRKFKRDLLPRQKGTNPFMEFTDENGHQVITAQDILQDEVGAIFKYAKAFGADARANGETLSDRALAEEGRKRVAAFGYKGQRTDLVRTFCETAANEWGRDFDLEAMRESLFIQNQPETLALIPQQQLIEAMDTEAARALGAGRREADSFADRAPHLQSRSNERVDIGQEMLQNPGYGL